jgi:hypothetical protein
MKGPEALGEQTQRKTPFHHQIISHLHLSLKAVTIDFNASSTSSPIHPHFVYL